MSSEGEKTRIVGDEKAGETGPNEGTGAGECTKEKKETTTRAGESAKDKKETTTVADEKATESGDLNEMIRAGESENGKKKSDEEASKSLGAGSSGTINSNKDKGKQPVTEENVETGEELSSSPEQQILNEVLITEDKTELNPSQKW